MVRRWRDTRGICLLALDFPHHLPVGIIGAIATLALMPNYTMQTRRFDVVGFLLLATGMATLTLALDGQKGLGISSLTLAILIVIGMSAILWYLWHARGNDRALFSLTLFKNPYLPAWTVRKF